MDKLHTMLRSIRGETKSRDHIAVFREFLHHLERLGRRRPPRRPRPLRLRRAPRR